MSLMSGKEMCFQVPPKTFRLSIVHRIRHWVPSRQTGERWHAKMSLQSVSSLCLFFVTE